MINSSKLVSVKAKSFSLRNGFLIDYLHFNIDFQSTGNDDGSRLSCSTNVFVFLDKDVQLKFDWRKQKLWNVCKNISHVALNTGENDFDICFFPTPDSIYWIQSHKIQPVPIRDKQKHSSYQLQTVRTSEAKRVQDRPKQRFCSSTKRLTRPFHSFQLFSCYLSFSLPFLIAIVFSVNIRLRSVSDLLSIFYQSSFDPWVIWSCSCCIWEMKDMYLFFLQLFCFCSTNILNPLDEFSPRGVIYYVRSIASITELQNVKWSENCKT